MNFQPTINRYILQGRQGKGAIYVFASGNGKHLGDNCGADGYINSIYTIPIASANQEGKAVFYGDRCSAIMATAYSSGGPRNEMIVSTSNIEGQPFYITKFRNHSFKERLKIKRICYPNRLLVT